MWSSLAVIIKTRKAYENDQKLHCSLMQKKHASTYFSIRSYSPCFGWGHGSAKDRLHALRCVSRPCGGILLASYTILSNNTDCLSEVAVSDSQPRAGRGRGRPPGRGHAAIFPHSTHPKAKIESRWEIIGGTLNRTRSELC